MLDSHDLHCLEKAPDRAPCRYCVDVRPAVPCCKPGDHHRINVHVRVSSSAWHTSSTVYNRIGCTGRKMGVH